ncbi:hypothetical protein WOLCODRAFT_119037 [Wolfiporia cocos MD-104 SS10]|uniref:1-alkyl-2-acetylglycerophosphocholine esterase n=1 Tax=Wolfiporia cocos (strain MD-104) TaxID=742152 RepID=A0A2H3JNK6_WOLCO|nr:hypothetical protein WOLCODRAFT_119037 [Wolfiporia cocos MD-104 SS10]
MFTLPDVPGPFVVGATTFAIPLQQPQTIGAAKLRRTGGNTPREPALLLEEIVFTAFYPADIRKPSTDGTAPEKLKKAMDWVAKPVNKTIRGYAHFAKLPFWLSNVFMGCVASRLKLPVYPNVPLLDPTEASDDPQAQWPLVFFSHGLSGTRTTYSHLCIRLASQGKVVLAMEHRDGTAPVVTSHFEPASAEGKKRHKPKVKYYLHPEDVMYENQEEEQTKSAFRIDQLLFRRLETYLAFMAFSDLINARPRADIEKSLFGNIYTVWGPTCAELPRHSPLWQSWTTGRVQFKENIAIVGHSFGGASTLSIISNPPPSLPDTTSHIRFEPLPITHALVLDPWLEPLPTPGPAPHAGMPRAPHILVLNSEEFTLWDDHFARLAEVVRAWRRTGPGVDAQLLTFIRAKHVSFSDLGVIWPLGHLARDGRTFLRVTGDLALAFLANRTEEAIQGVTKREMEVEHVRKRTLKSAPPGTRRRRIVGGVGEVVVHDLS